MLCNRHRVEISLIAGDMARGHKAERELVVKALFIASEEGRKLRQTDRLESNYNGIYDANKTRQNAIGRH